MYKKDITYHDLDGNEITETFLFHFQKAELIEMQHSVTGGMVDRLMKIINARKDPEVFGVVKSIILDAVGERSDDGKRFIKTPEIRTNFEQSEAYSVLLEELLSDSTKCAEFVNKIMPSDLAKELEKATKNGTVLPLPTGMNNA